MCFSLWMVELPSSTSFQGSRMKRENRTLTEIPKNERTLLGPTSRKHSGSGRTVNWVVRFRARDLLGPLLVDQRLMAVVDPPTDMDPPSGPGGYRVRVVMGAPHLPCSALAPGRPCCWCRCRRLLSDAGLLLVAMQ